MRGNIVRIGVVAGEPSGDSLGAGLINAVKRVYPDAEFIGVGGPKMSKAGCDTLYDMDRIGLMGLEGVFEKLARCPFIRLAKSWIRRNHRGNFANFKLGTDRQPPNLNKLAGMRSHNGCSENMTFGRRNNFDKAACIAFGNRPIIF